jgi:hypothetical protein
MPGILFFQHAQKGGTLFLHGTLFFQWPHSDGRVQVFFHRVESSRVLDQNISSSRVRVYSSNLSFRTREYE